VVQIFANPQQRLHLDVGCGKGHYLDTLAINFPDWNFLGLEIRKPLVESANRRLEMNGLSKKNIYFQYGNITMCRPLFESLPCRAFHRVSILFPDPWFKKKHHKRRITQPKTLQLISEFLVPNGLIFFVTDVEEMANASKDAMNSIASLEEVHGYDFEKSEFPVIREFSKPFYSQKPKYSFVFRRK
jgi:tRNA (guanine-N7-)-methyltransferase